MAYWPDIPRPRLQGQMQAWRQMGLNELLLAHRELERKVVSIEDRLSKQERMVKR